MVVRSNRQKIKQFALEKKKLVVAIGGNAILRNKQMGTFEEQARNVLNTGKSNVSIILDQHNYKVVAVTHEILLSNNPKRIT
jgi:hypothetical protein